MVRCLHWLLVASIVVAWASVQGWLRSAWHEPAGYVASALLLIRVGWGFAGGRYARFAQFVRAPRRVLDYARRVRRGREPRCIGHNPLGGWMVVALLFCAAATVFSGWLLSTDRYWGSAPVSALHALLAWSLLVLIALHVIGVAFTSLRHRENLLRAMITGRKRAAAGDDIA